MRWLQLIRLPTVFTAMADIFLGFLLVTGGRFEPPGEFLLVLLASACLYFAGMVLNDLFDMPRDAVERPDRPLPSGAISSRAAATLAVVLCAAGVVTSAATGAAAGVVAVLVIVAILLYDWLLKATPLAPLAMGLCRFLNVLLGAAAVADFSELGSPPLLLLATCLGTYIAGLTWFARKEAVGENRIDLIGGSLVMNIGMACLIATVLTQPNVSHASRVALLLTFMACTIDRRLIAAIRSGQPRDIGGGIRIALLSLVVLDASLVLAFSGSVTAAVATVCLLLPALIVRRWIPLT